MNYIVDIIVFGSESGPKGFRDFWEKQFTFKKRNVYLEENKIKFQSQILTDKSIEVDPEKILAIGSFQAPRNKAKIRFFWVWSRKLKNIFQTWRI